MCKNRDRGIGLLVAVAILAASGTPRAGAASITSLLPKKWFSSSYLTSALSGGGSASSASTASAIAAGERAAIESFLNGGPDVWSKNPPLRLPRALVLISPDGSLKGAPVVPYLEWVRARDPRQFDARHPKLGPLLQKQDDLAATRNARAPQWIRTVAVSQPPGVAGHVIAMSLNSGSASTKASGKLEAQILGPLAAPVPEPSAALAALALFGLAGCWWKGRRPA